jgi:hypothetical protein
MNVDEAATLIEVIDVALGDGVLEKDHPTDLACDVGVTARIMACCWFA